MSFKNWSEMGLILITTADGSPSLRLPVPVRPEFNDGESMHHSGGALEETLYIYGPVCDFSLKKKPSKHLVVGLGLGYIEMVIAIKALQQAITVSALQIESFESEEPLRVGFRSFLEDLLPEGEVKQTYEWILQGALRSLNAKSLSAKTVKDFLRQTLKIHGALSLDNLPKDKFHGIYFDAFSKKTSPDLWTEDFLKTFFSKTAAPDICAVGTYACTGHLKRCLRGLDFQLEDKLGFKVKRDATFAVRAQAT